MASADELKESHPATLPPRIDAAPPPPPPAAAAAATISSTTAAAAVASPHLARFAFLILGAMMSVSWFIEPFAAAAVELRLPWSAVVATVVFFAALFYASVHLFRSFFLPRSQPATAAAAAQGGWERVGAIAVAVAVVGVGIAACLVAAGGSAYGEKLFSAHRFVNYSFCKYD
ncbi:hypothetical protein ACP70R_006916 [Stipagrostis hirtigluma subsp. patula]